MTPNRDDTQPLQIAPHPPLRILPPAAVPDPDQADDSKASLHWRVRHGVTFSFWAAKTSLMLRAFLIFVGANPSNVVVRFVNLTSAVLYTPLADILPRAVVLGHTVDAPALIGVALVRVAYVGAHHLGNIIWTTPRDQAATTQKR